VEFGDEDLQQLDVDFSDLEEEDHGSGESGDEDYSFDQPMVSNNNTGF
jgi:hypothetical protein